MASKGLNYQPVEQDLNHAEQVEQKQCSVRGCHRVFAADGPTKMCQECRSKHRVYATTKRLRRKLEKAAMQVIPGGSVSLGAYGGASSSQGGEGSGRNSGKDPITGGVGSEETTPGVQGASDWNNEADWELVVDPMLYALSTSTTPGVQIASSSSELVNALNLSNDYLQFGEHGGDNASAECISPSMLEASEDSTPGAGSDSNGPPRFCSVKGCKAVIPGSYDYKMCPSCRTRYRGYGITKRAKWKNEREAFEREMTQLRAAEDERRQTSGLPPLGDNPEELRAWEMSIIDEQITLPSQILAALNAAGVNPDGTVSGPPGEGSIVPSILSLYQNDPSHKSKLDTPHSTAPYLGSIPPLPARMCTVSHCHQILPGYYRYKRCEQHRLQNRHHSKLKRVREKEEKAVGPKEGAEVVSIPAEAVEPNKKSRGKEKAEGAAPDDKRESSKKSKKTSTHCAKEGCTNILPQEKRWKDCDDCRRAERQKKMLVKVGQEGVEQPEAAGDIVRSATPANSDERRPENMTADTFQSVDGPFRWKNNSAVVDSSVPSPDLSRPSSRPSTSQQPLVIRHYQPKGDEESGGRLTQPYVFVEQFPGKNMDPPAETDAPPSSATHATAPGSAITEPASMTGQISYPDDVFRHYVPAGEKEPSAIPSAIPDPPPATKSGYDLPEPESISTVRKVRSSKPKSKGKGKVHSASANEATAAAPAPPLPYPYSQYPLHPYLYLPPQYTVNGYGHLWPAPGSVTAAGKPPGEPGASISAPSHPLPLPYPFPHLPYPYGPPPVTGLGQPHASPYYFPSYPYSVSAPPGLGVPPGPALVPSYQFVAGHPATSVSAPPLATNTTVTSTSTSASAPPAPVSVSAPRSRRSSANKNNDPSEPPALKFTYYHPGYGSTDSPDAPILGRSDRKKRRKIDPAWLEKMRLRAEERVAGAGSNAETTETTAVDVTAPSAAALPPAAAAATMNDTHETPSQIPPAVVPSRQVSETDPDQQRVVDNDLAGGHSAVAAAPHTLPSEHEQSPSAQEKPCSNNACRRRVVSSSAGTSAFCPKCKTRFRKYTEKTKRKHNLVPVKVVPATIVGAHS